jgi:hypothetical protein
MKEQRSGYLQESERDESSRARQRRSLTRGRPEREDTPVWWGFWTLGSVADRDLPWTAESVLSTTVYRPFDGRMYLYESKT